MGALLFLHSVSHGERVVMRRPLRELPLNLKEWSGTEIPIEKQIVVAAGVDDYVNRIYRNSQDGAGIALYVGYYGSQRSGDTIHSPKNCLPGSGWQPLTVSRIEIPLAGRPPIQVNQYVVEKGLDRQLVMYWYQGRGRVIASEYAGKWWMVVDAIRRNRTDGALVRVSSPLQGGEESTRLRVTGFCRELYPYLHDFIPN